MFKTASKLRGAFASIAYQPTPTSCLPVTLPVAGGTTVDDATTAENDRRPGRPKRGPRHGLGAQGLPAGERATELSYAARVSIAGRAWLERGHPSQVV